MKLTKEQARIKIIATILGERHRDYDHTVNLAMNYKRFNTGKNIDPILIRYNPNETEEEFEQRKRITKVITPALTSSVMKPFLKVPRTDRVVKKIIPKNKSTDKKIESEIQHKLDLFYGSDSEEGGLDFWLRNRFVQLSFTDPNAFIVIEFDDFDNKEETPNAYPFEVSSANALNYDTTNNNTQWLVAREFIKFESRIQDNKVVFEDGEKFTIYCGEFSIVFRRVSSNSDIRLNYALPDDEEIVEVKGNHFYAVSYYETKLPDWQLFRVGYIQDIETDDRTFVNPYHSAYCYLEKSIKAVSEMDLTNASHVFPQKYAYVSTCQGEPDDTCNKGYNREGVICKSCKGAGTKIHTSSQQVITMPLPESNVDAVPLKDMVAYFSPPMDLLEFQYKVVNDFEPKIHQAVFNTTVLVQKTIVATATEKEQDIDSVYDTLIPFASKCSAVYLNVCNAVAVLLGYEKRVTFVYRYPADFKMKTRLMLYNETKTATESNVPSFVLESVQDEFAYQVYIDDPEGMIKYKVKKRFTPFVGKSQEEIIFCLSSPLTLKKSKILYLNFEEIFSEAEQINQNFYILDYKAQKAIIDKIVEDYMNEMKSVDPVFKTIEVV